jgi:hypothetical protein
MQWNKSLHGKLKATGTSAGLRKLIFGRLIRIKARSGFAHLHTDRCVEARLVKYGSEPSTGVDLPKR